MNYLFELQISLISGIVHIFVYILTWGFLELPLSGDATTMEKATLSITPGFKFALDSLKMSRFD